MALDKPVAAYIAANNIEAQMIAEMLRNAGLKAAAVDDVSSVWGWVGGIVSQLHKPEVFVDEADLEKARQILIEYEDGKKAEVDNNPHQGPIKVECEECGKWSIFAEDLRGSVQNCPHCQAFVDVGDDVPFDGWEEGAEEAGEQDAKEDNA